MHLLRKRAITGPLKYAVRLLNKLIKSYMCLCREILAEKEGKSRFKFGPKSTPKSKQIHLSKLGKSPATRNKPNKGY